MRQKLIVEGFVVLGRVGGLFLRDDDLLVVRGERVHDVLGLAVQLETVEGLDAVFIRLHARTGLG